MASLKHARNAVDNLVSELKKDQTAGIIVQSAEKLSDGYARVVATVTHSNGSRDSKVALSNAIRSKFDNKLHIVDDSFTVLSKNSISHTLVGILSVMPQAISYEKGMSGFSILAGNMYMDEEENLWALRKTEAGDILVKAFGKDDAEIVSGILETAASSGFTGAYESVAAVEDTNKMISGVQGGDFVTYVEPQSGKVSFGAVVAAVFNEDDTDSGKLYIVDRDAGPAQFVDRGMVLASWLDVSIPNDTDPNDEVATARANVKSPEEIAAYYQKVFQRNQAYFEKFMERWRSQSYV